MRCKFDEQLLNLNKELINMGMLCEEAISLSARALDAGDMKAAKNVSALSTSINEKGREIEALCMKLLLQQQPVAKDLRTISSALKMITDLARIGVQSADIAEIISMANIEASDDTCYINEMSLATIKMVKGSIDAFVKKDGRIAKEIINYDDVVDEYFNKVKQILIKEFSKPGTNGEYALDLLMIAKYFERIGDHATNIAKWVLYSLTGKREGE